MVTNWDDCATCEEQIKRVDDEPWQHEDKALDNDHRPKPRDHNKPVGPKLYADYHLIDFINDEVRGECTRRDMTYREFGDFLVTTLERVLQDAKETQRVNHVSTVAGLKL
jgi:hypothetical protein